MAYRMSAVVRMRGTSLLTEGPGLSRDQWSTEETVKEEHNIKWAIPIVIGTFAGMIVIVLVVCFFVKRKPSKKAVEEASEVEISKEAPDAVEQENPETETNEEVQE